MVHPPRHGSTPLLLVLALVPAASVAASVAESPVAILGSAVPALVPARWSLDVAAPVNLGGLFPNWNPVVAVSPGGGQIYSTGSVTSDFTALVAAYGSDGAALWNRTYGSTGAFDWSSDVLPSLDGTWVFASLNLVLGPGIDAGIVVALDGTTGQEVWRFEREAGAVGRVSQLEDLALASDGATLYGVGVWSKPGPLSRTGYLVALDAVTGAVRWEAMGRPGGLSKVAVTPDGATVVAAGTTLAGHHSEVVVRAHGADDGGLRWDRDLANPEGDDQLMTLAIDPVARTFFVLSVGESYDGSLPDELLSSAGVHDADGSIAALDLLTGVERWTARFATLPGSADVLFDLALDPTGTTLYVGGFVSSAPNHFAAYLLPYQNTNDGLFLALEASSGAVRWARPYALQPSGQDTFSQIVVTPDGRVFATLVSANVDSLGHVGSPNVDSAYLEFDPASGLPVWGARFDELLLDGLDEIAVSPDGKSLYGVGLQRDTENRFGIGLVAFDLPG